MTGQEYRVIADRDKGDDLSWHDVEPEDRYTSIKSDGPYPDPLMRIERPVPTEHCLGTHYHDSHLWTGKPGTHYWCKGYAAPDEILPTREQIAEALYLRRFHYPPWDRLGSDQERWLRDADAVLALLQKGADRG